MSDTDKQSKFLTRLARGAKGLTKADIASTAAALLSARQTWVVYGRLLYPEIGEDMLMVVEPDPGESPEHAFAVAAAKDQGGTLPEGWQKRPAAYVRVTHTLALAGRGYMLPEFDRRTACTIINALRTFQKAVDDDCYTWTEEYVTPLDNDEIDDLCEEINFSN